MSEEQTLSAAERLKLAKERMAQSRVPAKVDATQASHMFSEDDAKLVSDETVERLKHAGSLTAAAGKWGAGKAKEVASAAADKARQATAAAERMRVERMSKAAQASAINQAPPPEQVLMASLPEPEVKGAVALAPVGRVSGRHRVKMSTRKQARLVIGATAFAIGLGCGAWWWMQQTQEETKAPTAVQASATPPATVPVPATPVVVETPAPEPVVPPSPVPVKPDPVDAAPAPVVRPPVVATPISKPEPTAKRVARKSVEVPIRPVREPSKPAPAAQPAKPEWQDKAMDDLDAFEKQLGG